jgi:hypothetical protein
MENASTSMEDVLPPGTRLGPYEIGAPIGAGGMGVVYRARDPRLDRDVAIKLLPPFAAGDGEARARFEREARLIAQLQHPNVCALYDVGREGERDFLVMELLDGESLAQRLERGPLALSQLVTIGAAIADALAAAHRRGILHRDLKPGNVMLSRGGAKLLDFGLAKLHAPAVDARPIADRETRLDSAISGAGTIAGTLVYMAPEQLEGKPLDARADIWGLGCVLYEMASGRRPFSGESAASTIASILQQEPPLLAELVPLTPPALEHLVRTCLAKDPEQRWQSAADLARELRWLGDSRSARSSAAGMAPVDPASRPRRLARAALPWLGLSAGALLALAGLVVAARRAPAVARLPVRSTLPFVERRLDPFQRRAADLSRRPTGRRGERQFDLGRAPPPAGARFRRAAHVARHRRSGPPVLVSRRTLDRLFPRPSPLPHRSRPGHADVSGQVRRRSARGRVGRARRAGDFARTHRRPRPRVGAGE